MDRIFVLLLCALVGLAPARPAAAGAVDEAALTVVLAAYRRLRAEHMVASEPRALLRSAAAGMHRLVAAAPGSRRTGVRAADVPRLSRPLESLSLRGREAQDVGTFREHFLWTTVLAHGVAPHNLAHAAVRGMAESFADPFTMFMPPDEYLRYRERERARTGRGAVSGAMVGRGVGYVRIDRFSEATGTAAATRIRALIEDGARGMVLDLRGNGGGSVLGAMVLASVFLDQGNILIAVGRRGKTIPYPVLPIGVRFEGPVAVLVDGETASASEIVAGVLQERGAVLIGTRTFGKAVIQSIASLGDGSALQYTTARYLTPRGRDLQQRGLTPDIALPGESPTLVFRRAAEWVEAFLH